MNNTQKENKALQLANENKSLEEIERILDCKFILFKDPMEEKYTTALVWNT